MSFERVTSRIFEPPSHFSSYVAGVWANRDHFLVPRSFRDPARLQVRTSVGNAESGDGRIVSACQLPPANAINACCDIVTWPVVSSPTTIGRVPLLRHVT